jgi:organic hydroperoxide reductase OsmC/OhrA
MTKRDAIAACALLSQGFGAALSGCFSVTRQVCAEVKEMIRTEADVALVAKVAGEMQLEFLDTPGKVRHQLGLESHNFPPERVF